MGRKNNNGDDEYNTKSEDKKSQGGGGKKQENIIAVALKIDLHCDGCADRLAKQVRSLQGVESVKRADTDMNKLTVIGSMDPSKLRDSIEKRTKKKVEIISPKKDKDNKNDGNGNDKGNSGDKAAKTEKKSKDPPVTTAVLKVPLHCDGCIQKIQKLVYKTKGYMEMSIDKQKEVVTVKGAMDIKALAALLTKKLKRNVEIVPAKKEKGDNEKRDGGDEAADGGKSGGKTEGNKKVQMGTEYAYGYHQYWQEPGYMPSSYLHAPQLFSDENPNACVVM
ncbi:hypothetical protein DCAR_0623279 [Daucus carota subsp. sativus]|uniref:HMA domain-containing protein n=1 Tax=Daucus carota subsp. sativus TaxID=79200 RepID=A0AAF1B433_DAUCS|nr:hypothetical protein DCAR_0623279 [Daucus carota subsp. sativus]